MNFIEISRAFPEYQENAKKYGKILKNARRYKNLYKIFSVISGNL